jgi:hypothetical protein
MFNEPLDILFSGGIDSEIVLRVYKELKIPVNVFICRYENEYNYREFTHAIKICDSLSISPTIIDFNLERFIENEAYDIWTKCYSPSSGWLPQIKIAELVDNIPVYCDGEPYWKRQSDGIWMYELDEASRCWANYYCGINRSVITQWYEYSPEIILSHLHLPLIDNLINDRIYGKQSSFSSKAVIHQQYWDDIIIRPKLVGFEGENVVGTKPEFMIEFENQFINKEVTNKIYKFTKETLVDSLIKN